MAVGQDHRPARVVGGVQPEAHPRVVAAEGVDEVGHQPRPQGQLEDDRDRPGLRVDELLDGSEPVVEGVQGGVHVPLEHHARVGGPEHPPAPEQERRADLLLESRQRARDAGLADQVELGDLGDGGSVGDELEPPERLHVHSITVAHGSVPQTTLDVWVTTWNAHRMTFKKQMLGRRNGRHALRSSAAVAAILGAHHDETTALHADARYDTDATRNVLAHTSQEWNALRHAV